MKTLHTLVSASAVACALAAPATLAATSTVLEGFENGLDRVSLISGGARPSLDPPGVELGEYVTTGAEDPYVTEGQKALKVVLRGSEWWSADFRVTLSDEASSLVRAAKASGDVARYILRWEYTFPPSGTTAWMNSQVFIPGVLELNDQLDSNNGRLSHSITLDAISDLPAEGPLLLDFAQNFDANEDPFSELVVYVDNIRLIDTYAPGASPVTYPLQSFETTEDPIGGAANFTGWGGGTRTTYSQYTAEGAADPRVTDGSKSLKVDYANAGTWGSDFVLPFAGTKLAEVLKLDLPAEERPAREELIRYTLRFDVIYPEQGADWSGNWMSTSFNTLTDGFPVSQGGYLAAADAVGFKKTVSLTLDQVRWSDSVDPKPQLMFIANGAWGASGTSIYYDNFRLIDTGATGGGATPKLTAVQFNAGTGSVSLSWQSEAGKNYAIERTTALGSWPDVQAASVAGQAGTTTYTGTVPAAGQTFFRIRALN